MTAAPLAPTAPRPAATADRLRALLLVDAVGTAALGAAALLAAEPLAELVATPAVLRVVGVLFLVVAADMLLARRLAGRALSRAGVALGAADLLFGAVALGWLALAGASAGGTALVLGVVAVCAVMGTAKLRLS